jgi:two-component system, cell cycle sensor histidine kinase and response regulator CckA
MMDFLRAFGALFFNHATAAKAASSNDNDEPMEEERYKCTVLAIDDDPTAIEVIRPLLRAEGFKVLTSPSGAKGLDLLRYARDVQVILLDYNMPQLNGAETLAHIRKLNPRVKVIAVTGVDAKLLPSTFRQGVEKLVQKPFRSHELVEALNDLLRLNAVA